MLDLARVAFVAVESSRATVGVAETAHKSRHVPGLWSFTLLRHRIPPV